MMISEKISEKFSSSLVPLKPHQNEEHNNDDNPTNDHDADSDDDSDMLSYNFDDQSQNTARPDNTTKAKQEKEHLKQLKREHNEFAYKTGRRNSSAVYPDNIITTNSNDNSINKVSSSSSSPKRKHLTAEEFMKSLALAEEAAKSGITEFTTESKLTVLHRQELSQEIQRKLKQQERMKRFTTFFACTRARMSAVITGSGSLDDSKSQREQQQQQQEKEIYGGRGGKSPNRRRRSSSNKVTPPVTPQPSPTSSSTSEEEQTQQQRDFQQSEETNSAQELL